MMSTLSRIIALLRFKVFRLMSTIFIGHEGASVVIGQCISSDFELANKEIVRDRVLVRRLLSDAIVQRYDLKSVPDCWSLMFSRAAVFPRRFAYILEDIVIGSGSGVMFIPPKKKIGGDGIILLPSACNPYFFFQSGVQEVIRKPKIIDESLPVCPMPVIGYYHEMFEGLIRVYIAKKVFGNIKMLVSRKRPKYIDDMLSFVGIKGDEIIYSDTPLRVKKGVLIPRWFDCGENLKEDVCEFRDYLVSRLPKDIARDRKLYISRAKSRRSLPDEKAIEKLLEGNGFRICYFEDMSFMEQLKAVYSADIIVSPHGAGLSNIIVAKSGTKIIEIMTQGWANNCYGHLAASLGLDYVCVDADSGNLVAELGMLLSQEQQ